MDIMTMAIENGETTSNEHEVNLIQSPDIESQSTNETSDELKEEIIDTVNGNNCDTIDFDKDKDTDENEDDDDFGDFNEGDDDFNDFKGPTTENNLQAATPSLIDGFVLTGDPEQHRDKINELIRVIFPPIKKDNDTTVTEEADKESIKHEAFKLNERCENIYGRLIQEPINLKQINWKKSMIRRQLFLNLQIPIDLDEILPPSVVNKNNNFSNHYDSIATNGLKNSNTDEDRIVELITKFDDLTINSSERNEIIRGTNELVDELTINLQPLTYYKNNKITNKNDELKEIKSELVKIANCWFKNLDDLKKDNSLFSSYVENLVGNTQKKRRQK